MARSTASTPEAYLAALPDAQRVLLAAVRALVRQHLPEGYEETMRFGMLSYEVPLAHYAPAGGQPLPYLALAAQKHYGALYLMGASDDPERQAWLAAQFAAAGKKLDMGRACLRFRALDDLPLDALGTFVASMPPDELIARYEAGRAAKPSP